MSRNRFRKKSAKKSNWGRILVVLLVVAAAVGMFIVLRGRSETAQVPPEGTAWFDVLSDVEPLSGEQESQVASEVFKNIFQETPAAPNALTFADNQPRMLFLSLSDGTSKAKVLFQSGLNLQDTIDGLLRQADDLTANGFAPVWVKLDFVTDVSMDKSYDLTSAGSLPRSLNGLAFEAESGIALLPEVLVAETIIDSQQVFRAANLAHYLDEAGQPSEFAQALESAASALVYRFSTSAYFYEDGQIIPLYRGHRSFPVFTSEELLASAISGGSYLTDAVDRNRRFVYSYLPESDSESEDYNILRHAGTMYAILDLYKQTGD